MLGAEPGRETMGDRGNRAEDEKAVLMANLGTTMSREVRRVALVTPGMRPEMPEVERS
ncbi:MAG: hypothetical protein ABR592_13105 [Nitriliruptorales bacterium]